MKIHSIRRFWFATICTISLAGLTSTLLWLAPQTPPPPGKLMLALGLMILGTSANLFTRWVRWHFLLRTFGLRLRAQESTALFFSLLPMIFTPWACGEMLMGLALRRFTPHPGWAAAGIWLVSRGADLAALVLLNMLICNNTLPIIIVVFLLTTLVLSSAEKTSRVWMMSLRAFLFLGLSLAAWGFVVFTAGMAVQLLGAEITFEASVHAFTTSTVGGAFSGAPGGIVLTGSSLIFELVDAGASPAAAAWSAATLRWGTVGTAVLLGLGTLWACRNRLAQLVLDKTTAHQGHFEELASDYAAQIPVHVRDRLIETKSGLLLRIVLRHRVPTNGRGLDIGCGQGWYLAQMARSGYTMTGCDLTAGQIAQAQQFCTDEGISADLHIAGAESLPFAAQSFDFAYAINVFHHITDPEVRLRAFSDVVRVLKPGAPLVLIEMNTLNPLFRFYMSYIFPLLRDIDDGTEIWLSPDHPPVVPGAKWSDTVDFLTFVPDFVPSPLLRPLVLVESALERSLFKRFSAHFAISLINDLPTTPHPL